MRSLFVLFLAYVVSNLGLIALGVMISFPIRWIFPSVDRGMAILIGLVSTGLSLHFYMRFLAMSEQVDFPQSDLDVEDDRPEYWNYPAEPPRPKRKRNRKSP